MADEQTPQSDLIDDAIRQAERQLEAKLEALRMSALGEPSRTSEPADDVAVLRPTGGSSLPRTEAPVPPVSPQVDPWQAAAGDLPSAPPAPLEAPAEPATSWHQAEGEDVTFAPVDEGSVTLSGSELYVPGDDVSFDEVPHELQPHEEPAVQAEPHVAAEAAPEPEGHAEAWEDAPDPAQETNASEPTTLRAEVSDLHASWDDEDPEGADEAPEPLDYAAPSSPSSEFVEPAGPTSSRLAATERFWEPAAPVHAEASAPRDVVAVPTEDEMQFWAHTRTALRNLHQLTEGIPNQVGEELGQSLRAIVSDEIAPSGASLRMVQQQLQQQLPRLQSKLEAAIEQSSAGPTSGIRQLRDELPKQVDRGTRELRELVRDDVDTAAMRVHDAVRADVGQLEQSIATNVTRMATETTSAISTVGRDVTELDANVQQLGKGVRGEFDRVEGQLRAAIERVEQSMRAELVEPTETVRKLDDELPARFGRVERTVLDQLQTTQRELSGVLGGLVDATRVSLERLGSINTIVETERSRRAQDSDVIVDTITTGWEGLAGAIKALYEQGEQTSRRIGAIEERLTQLRDLEGTVESTMRELRDHVGELSPAPIVVTVSHGEAEVRNETRAGWSKETSTD